MVAVALFRLVVVAVLAGRRRLVVMLGMMVVVVMVTMVVIIVGGVVVTAVVTSTSSTSNSSGGASSHHGGVTHRMRRSLVVGVSVWRVVVVRSIRGGHRLGHQLGELCLTDGQCLLVDAGYKEGGNISGK